MSFEQREIWKVSQGEDVESRQCPYCSESSPMIAAEKLAKVMCESPRDIYKQIDEGVLHFIETERMQVLVCLASFSKRSVDNNNEKEILVKL